MNVSIIQPNLPHYRIPVYDRIGLVDGISLTVYAGKNAAGLYDGEQNTYSFSVEPAPERVQSSVLGPRMTQPKIAEVIAQRPDVLVLAWAARNKSVWQGVERARRNGIPVLLWGHGYSKHPSAIRDWARNRLGRRADGVLLYTRTNADQLISDHGFDRDRVFVAQNAIDQAPINTAREAWQGDAARLAAFQKEHGLDPERTIIHVSRLYEENGVDVMLKALAKAHKQEGQIKLVIVGDGPLREPLQHLADELSVGNSIIWAGAIYDEQDMAPWMLSSTVFCYPRNIGLSVLHAFGYGLPAVTGDHMPSHNPEIEALKDGENGVLARDRDVDDFARVWLELLNDKARRNDMSRVARDTVSQEYTIDKMADGFVEAIRALYDGTDGS